MERKRIIQIEVIAIALCGICLIGIECNRYFKEVERKAEHMTLIQKHFADLIDFGHEYQESIEQLSVASVEQMIIELLFP